MDRDTALSLLITQVKNKNLVKHCLACEAVLGLPLDRFIALGVKAMQGISGELGL